VTDQLKKRLLEDVVIFSGKQGAETGAQALAPDHSPRERYRASPLPARSAVQVQTDSQHQDLQHQDLQRQVEQFLFFQAELLDTKSWQAYIELFAEEGVYWMPARPEQTEWLDSPSIFAEDKQLMTVRMGRITHPNAWSQAPLWQTNHVLGNVVIEELTETRLRVRSRFQVLELRRDVLRSLAGVYRHTLLRHAQDFKIELQRVDLMNAQAPFDYTIQAWV
jgi:3-phenylpropionate/cinnamic acid dioxygenase small subunit